MADGTAVRVEIIDSGAAAGTFGQSESTVAWLDLVDTSFLLEWAGSTDHRHEPLVPSSCTVTMVQTDESHGELMDAIHANADHRFGIALFMFEPDENADASGHDNFADATGYWKPFWFGTIMADQGESEHLIDKRQFTITAQCGLVSLNDEPFRDDDDNAFEDERTLAVQIARCLSKLPTATLWGWNQYNGAQTPSVTGLDQYDVIRGALTDKPATPFFRECVWVQDKENHVVELAGVDVPGAKSVLVKTLCQSLAFVDVQNDDDAMGGTVRHRKYTSCGEVLAQIANVFGAQIFLSNGSWWFVNPDVHTSAVTGSGSYNRQHVWFSNNAMLADAYFGPLTSPHDSSALNVFDRGFDLSEGVTQNVLFPVKAVSSVHIEGGTRRIAQGSQHNFGGGLFGTRYDHAGDEIRATRGVSDWSLGSQTYTNTGCVLAGGLPITMSGRLHISRTGVRWVTAGYEYNTDKARGAKYLCQITIKCGSYYLTRNLVERSETAPIKNSVGSTVRTAHFYEQDGDIEWSTTAGTYDLVFPRSGCNPEAATVELSDGGGVIDFDFVGGLHCQRRDNNAEQFKATEGAALGIGSGTIQDSTQFEFGWTLPELPDGEDHEGVEIEFAFTLLDSQNDAITGTDNTDFFDPDGIGSEGSTIVFARMYEFDLVMGDGEDGGDVEFIALTDKNTTKIVTCESVLGDFYESTQANRGMRVVSLSDGTTKLNSAARWVVGDNIDVDGKYIHALRAAEVLQKRENPVQIRTGEMTFTDHANLPNPLSTSRSGLSASAFPILHFARPIRLAYTNGVNEWFNVMELKMTSEGYEFAMCKLSAARDLESITEADDSRIPRGPRPPHTITSDVPVARNPITNASFNLLERKTTSNVEAIEAEATTRAAADTTLQNNINALSSTVSDEAAARATNTTNIATNATAIATNTTAIATTTSALGAEILARQSGDTANASDITAIEAKTDFITASGSGITNITGDGTFVRADNVQTSQSRTFATSAQLTAIATNTTGVANNALNVTNLTSDVSDIQDKTDLLTVTQQHNLDTTKTKVGHITADATGISALTIKAGTTPLTADQISTTSTTNKFVSQAEKNKLGFVTVTSSVNLDTVRNTTEAITINGAGRITAFDIQSGTTPLNLDNVSNGTTNKFVTADDVTKLGNVTLNANDKIESLNIAGAYSGGTRVMDLGEMHDLLAGNYPNGTCPTTYGYLCAIAQSVNDAATANRSGQTGDVVALIDSDGKFKSIDDGTANQFLKTNGSGVISWATPKANPYVLAAFSMRVSLNNENNIYVGSSVYGWSHYTWTYNISASTLSLSATYSHCGIVVPEAFTKLRVRGTVKNDTAQNNTNVLILHGSRANGSTSNITLTELGSGTAATSTTQDAHENVDFLLTSLNVAAGDLVVVGIQRTTGGTLKQLAMASISISVTP